MPHKKRASIGKFAMQFCIAGVVALTLGYGLTRAAIATDKFGPRTESDQSILAQRVGAAREIKTALAKPLAPIEPLPPISSKIAGDVQKTAARDPHKNDKYDMFRGSSLTYVTLSPSGSRN